MRRGLLLTVAALAAAAALGGCDRDRRTGGGP